MGQTGDEWLTTSEAMRTLGIGRTRLWQLAKEGRLTAHHRGVDGRARYYRRDEVEQLAAEYAPAENTRRGRRRSGAR